ncbi:MAG: amidase [Candidatus Melainabacteria bacterium]|nr:amidase [Candidatus Melainabacteria bacterium]
MSDLHELTATQLTKKLRNNECTVKEVVSDCIKQTQTLEKDLQAWACLKPELVLAQAAHLDSKIKNDKKILQSKLVGIPVGVKDIFNTSDFPTQMGSPIWRGFEPGNDARVVHYLKMANALVFGKTVTAEFAVHAPGPTKNPHNPLHTPGTSSSGSAVSVAARMVPVALGTQTAGSIIRPSSYCGIFGLKPSFGLVPRTGVLKTTDTLDTIGCMARSIEDLRTVFDTIRVKGRDFPISEKIINDTQKQNKPVSRPWRIGVVKGPKWDFAESYAQSAILDFAKKLSKYDQFEVEEISLPAEFEQAHQIHSTIYDRTLAYYFQREFQKHTLVSGNIYEIITRGNLVTLAQYKQALEQQDRLYLILDQLFDSKCDIVLGLSTGGEALLGLDSVDRLDNCLMWTLCGVPSLNLPVFTGQLSLPFGAQIVARRYYDFQLLNFAQELQDLNLIPDVKYPGMAKQVSAISNQIADKVTKTV